MSGRDYAGLLREIGIPQRSRRGSLEPILELLERRPRGRALDVPCGPGLLSEALRRMGFQVTAADLRDDVFEARDTVPFRALDLDAPLPFPDASFDLVVCSDGIEHVENPFALFREFARVLDAGGSLVVATPNYLSLERRLRFLFSGSLARPLARGRGSGAGSDRGHINPLTFVRLAWMAEQAGLELAGWRTLLSKPRQAVLAPLAVCLMAYRAFLTPERRRDLFADSTLTGRMLLGGKKLLAEFRRKAA